MAPRSIPVAPLAYVALFLVHFVFLPCWQVGEQGRPARWDRVALLVGCALTLGVAANDPVEKDEEYRENCLSRRIGA